MKPRMLACLSVLLMVCIAAAPAAHAAHAAPAAASRYVVTISTPTTTMSLGKSLKVTGTVRGAGATKVTLYQRSGTRWVPWRSAGLVKGRYTVYYKPVSAGGHGIRVSTPATKKHRAGTSPSKTITVYTWRYLSDFVNTPRLVASSNWWGSLGNVANINGRAYLHTPYDIHQSAGETGYVEYNLSRACLTFRMTGGLTDESGTGGTAQLEVLTDGVQNWARTMSPGQSQAVSLSVQGGLRLRFADTIVTRAPSATNTLDIDPAFGDARVLCRF